MQKYYSDIDHAEAREWFDFFKNLRVFRGWGLDAIRNLLHYTRLCKYNSKQIISANTKNTTDIVIVKTGQVLVWTQLKRNTNSVTSYTNSFNFKETSTSSFILNEKITPTNSQDKDTPRSSKTDIRFLNNNALSKESFSEKSKNESLKSKSRLLAHSDSLRKSFNDKSFRLPDINRKPSSRFDKTTQNGLDSNLVKDHPNCQLISDECECFLINKDAFLNYTPIEFFEVLQYQYNEGFPSKEEIDTKFNEYIKWKSYRKKLFQETTIQRIRNKLTSFR